MARGSRILANRHIPAALFCRLVAIFERSRPWECRLEEEGQDRSISSSQGAGGVRYVKMWPTYASSSNFRKLTILKYMYVLIVLNIQLVLVTEVTNSSTSMSKYYRRQ